MWERYELKEKAKSSLRANYWKTVLVAFLVAAIAGAGMGAGAVSAANAALQGAVAGAGSAGYAGYVSTEHYTSSDPEFFNDFDTDSEYGFGEDSGYNFGEDEDSFVMNNSDMAFHHHKYADSSLPAIALLPVITLIILIIVVAIGAAAALQILIYNPLRVGISRFFLRNLNQPANVAEVGRGFDRNFTENFKTLFFMDLYIFGWSLLLVIPGIIKFYEYRMIPYLLADDPTMTRERAFAESRQMMDGNKWQTFVLDLSFIPWHLLAGLTLGILDIFYVEPYIQMTYAALYEALRYGTSPSSLPFTADEQNSSWDGSANHVPVPPMVSYPISTISVVPTPIETPADEDFTPEVPDTEQSTEIANDESTAGDEDTADGEDAAGDEDTADGEDAAGDEGAANDKGAESNEDDSPNSPSASDTDETALL